MPRTGQNRNTTNSSTATRISVRPLRMRTFIHRRTGREKRCMDHRGHIVGSLAVGMSFKVEESYRKLGGYPAQNGASRHPGRIDKEVDDVYPIGSGAPAPARGVAGVALQQGLGVLPERGARPRSPDPAPPPDDGGHLTPGRNRTPDRRDSGHACSGNGLDMLCQVTEKMGVTNPQPLFCSGCRI